MNGPQGYTGVAHVGAINTFGVGPQGDVGPVGQVGSTGQYGFQGPLGPQGFYGISNAPSCPSHKKKEFDESDAKILHNAVRYFQYEDIRLYHAAANRSLPCFLLDSAQDENMVSFLQLLGCCCVSSTRCKLTRRLLHCINFVPHERSMSDENTTLDIAVDYQHKYTL